MRGRPDKAVPTAASQRVSDSTVGNRHSNGLHKYEDMSLVVSATNVSSIGENRSFLGQVRKLDSFVTLSTNCWGVLWRMAVG